MSILVLALGGIGTLSLAYLTSHAKGAYATSTTVDFLVPRSETNPNVLTVQTDALIVAAGIVGTKVASDASRASLTSSGVRGSFTIQLVNHGSQFVNNFDQPLLTVSVQDATAPGAIFDTRTILTRIVDELHQLQTSAGSPAVDQLSVLPVPSVPQAILVGGSPKRAMAGSVILGVIVTGTALRLIRKLLRPRRPAGDLTSYRRPQLSRLHPQVVE